MLREAAMKLAMETAMQRVAFAMLKLLLMGQANL